MLQAIGVRAYYLHVDSHRGVIDPEAPSLWGNLMITAIELPDGENDPRLMARVKAINGRTLLIFDPTDEQTPVGLIRADLQGAWANISNGADSQVLEMPVLAPESSGLTRKGSFHLSSDGVLAGDVAEVFTGDNAATERRFIKGSDPRELREGLERRLGSDLPGVAFKSFEFRQAADLDKPLDLELNLSASGFANTSGPLMLLHPHIFAGLARVAPDLLEDRPRAYPIEIGHPGKWHDSFDIVLPPGYVVDETPKPVDVDLEFATYHSAVTAQENMLHYEREYVVRQVEIPAEKASEFRKLQSAIVADERGTAVLKKQ
jgi:hypothetical protein